MSYDVLVRPYTVSERPYTVSECPHTILERSNVFQKNLANLEKSLKKVQNIMTCHFNLKKTANQEDKQGYKTLYLGPYSCNSLTIIDL